VPGRVEVRRDLSGTLLERSAQRADLDQGGGDCGAERIDQLPHVPFAAGSTGVAVGGDHRLVDAPRRLDLQTIFVGEQQRDPLLLRVGEQIRTGGKGAARRKQWVAGAAALAQGAVALGVDAVPGSARPGGRRGRGPKPR
jgi:hypothetical protein